MQTGGFGLEIAFGTTPSRCATHRYYRAIVYPKAFESLYEWSVTTLSGGPAWTICSLFENPKRCWPFLFAETRLVSVDHDASAEEAIVAVNHEVLLCPFLECGPGVGVQWMYC